MHGFTGLITFAAIVFWIFFQINKGGPFPEINPFGVDPYDAVGSFDWTLVRVPAQKVGNLLPRRFVDWADRFRIDMLFTRVRWVHPRFHPWRFAAALGLLAGIALIIPQLQEGLPPSLATGLLATGIFISAEFSATLVGFAVFGGFLGLQPPLKIP